MLRAHDLLGKTATEGIYSSQYPWSVNAHFGTQALLEFGVQSVTVIYVCYLWEIDFQRFWNKSLGVEWLKYVEHSTSKAS